MKLEDIERQSFEEFGEIAVFQADPQEVDVVANDRHASDHAVEVHPHESDPSPAAAEPAAYTPSKTAFSWTAFAGGLAALIWVGGAIGGPLSYYGVDAVLSMDPAMQAGLIAIAFGPALLFWLAAAAAGEAVKARRLTAELARLAHEARMPSERGQAQAAKLSHAVKSEIETLNDAVTATLARLGQLEAAAQRNTSLFDSALSATRDNVAFMSGHLARERDALAELNSDMRGQTETMAQSIGRQVRLMREASKLVKTEVSAAEDALESHLASFAASASVMAERTSSFHQAADGAHDAAASMNASMSQMLDGLGEATRLTDAARQSSEQAVRAANETANAVRETTRGAIHEAKRAAQLVRAETTALQETAAQTLAQLQSAALAVRAASNENTPQRQAGAIDKRLAAIAATKPARENGIYAAASAAKAGREDETQRTRKAGWNGFSPRDGAAQKPTPELADAFELVTFSETEDADARLKHSVLHFTVACGVDLSEVLTSRDLERIAAQARNGAPARRRAVVDAAPGAVGRLSRHLKRDAAARSAAAEFRARPSLASSEDRAESKDLVRAYLLVDAALS